MKRYIYIQILALAAMMTACDYNERNFPGLDDLSRPANIYKGELTITEADLPAVIAALNASGEADAAAWAAALGRDKAFSDEAPAERIVPWYLKKLYYGVDESSSVNVTYRKLQERDQTVSALAGTPYRLTAEDYRSVWGDPYAEAFTPGESPAAHLPAILGAAIADPADGMYVNVEYWWSDAEPVPANVEQTVLEEDFESYTTVNEPTTHNGWTQFQESGTYTYQAKSYSGNWYAQISNGSSGQRKTWLISPETDLTELTAAQLTFDVKVGNYTATCLEIKISTDYDGGGDPTTAIWSDITSLFTLPVLPINGYGTNFEDAGSADLAAYAGQKIHVAFRYDGDAETEPKKTTTYQLDNVRVSQTIPGIEVAEKSMQYAAWRYDGDAARWKEAPADVLSLQPEDYAAMGVSYLSTEQAPDYIPVWLSGKFPYAQQDDERTVVFKIGANAAAAAKFIFSDGRWEAQSTIISSTDQFILSSAGWIFDPTVVVVLTKADYQVLVDYVIRTHAAGNSALVHKNNNAEYYYGFAAYYGNVTYRESDRKNDPLYPLEGSNAEKAAFMNARTIEGLGIYLAETMPQLTPDVGGVEQLAQLTVTIYNDPTADRQNVVWTYTLRCTAPGTWEFVQRESDDGTVETAP